MRIDKYLFLLFLFLMISSCSENEINNVDQVYLKEAKVIWQGDYAADGCGFFLDIDNKLYKPENEDFIDSEFKSFGSTPVTLKYVYSEKKIPYSCGFVGPQELDGVKILSIKKI